MSHDLLIVSAFGRGHWLAAEMAERGKSVHVLDMSKAMGRWAPEDWEGPFGLFMSDDLTDLQKERLIEEDYLDSVDHGFTAWLSDGPLETRGPLFSYRFQRKGYSEKLKEYLLHSNGPQNPQNPQALENVHSIKAMDFEKNWLAHLAHQLSANIFKDNPNGMDYNDPLPLMSSYAIRRTSRRGYQKNCDWLRSKGVHITTPLGIKDIVTQRGYCQYIKLIQSGGAEGSTSAQQFIWSLSSEESQFCLPSGVSEKLFPKGGISPQWSWFRYRVQFEPDDWLDVLPIKFTMIEEIDLPWTHTNLCIVQKTPQEYDYDTWVRLPNTYRQEKESLEIISQEIIELFKKKMPHCQPREIHLPQEHSYSSQELGPSLFPVYKEGSLKKIKRALLKNIHFDGPELWTSLDWGGRFKRQREILSLLEPLFYARNDLSHSTPSDPSPSTSGPLSKFSVKKILGVDLKTHSHESSKLKIKSGKKKKTDYRTNINTDADIDVD